MKFWKFKGIYTCKQTQVLIRDHNEFVDLQTHNKFCKMNQKS